MREIITERIVSLVSTYCIGSNRRRPIQTFLANKLYGSDCSTKAMRRQRDEIDLDVFDWDLLSEADLVLVFEIVVRQTYIQM